MQLLLRPSSRQQKLHLRSTLFFSTAPSHMLKISASAVMENQSYQR